MSLKATIQKASTYLLSHRKPDGFWFGEFEGNVALSVQTLLLYEVLGISTTELKEGFRKYILSKQNADGTWPLYFGGPPDLSTTVEAYWGLKITGEAQTAAHMILAKDAVLKMGGAQNSRILTQIFFALFGYIPYHRLPFLPPELLFLPVKSGLSIYELACYARMYAIPLMILKHTKKIHRLLPQHQINELFIFKKGLIEWQTHHRESLPGFLFSLFEKSATIIERFCYLPWRKLTIKRATHWLLEHQEPDGRWYNSPPTILALFSLHSLGYTNDKDPMKRGLQHLENLRWINHHTGEWHQMAADGPVWDTIMSCQALIEAECTDDRIKESFQKILQEQRLNYGDWKLRCKPGTLPGGWAFSRQNFHYPDVDSTSEACLLILKSPWKSSESHNALERGKNWILGMQNTTGSWCTFDRNAISKLFSLLSINDPSGHDLCLVEGEWADTTGRQLELLGKLGYDLNHDVIQAAVTYLRSVQNEDGSFYARWATCHIFGTTEVLKGLSAIGADFNEPWIQAALNFLKRIQNADGGFGESNESYQLETYIPLGKSIPSQTAWALIGLLQEPGPPGHAALRAATWLCEHQNLDGSWSEKEFTGGVLKKWVFRYQFYPIFFPLLALARYQSRLKIHGGIE